MAEALEFARDFFILAAQHPEEFERLRENLERRDAARTAIAEGATTRPNGGSVVSILEAVRR